MMLEDGWSQRASTAMDAAGASARTREAAAVCERALDEAYFAARDLHPGVDVDAGSFRRRVSSLCSTDPSRTDAMPARIRALHTSDLYLATACVAGSIAGWARFRALFRAHLVKVMSRYATGDYDGGELADSLLVDLFLPDRSGKRALASYCGRSALAAWLRAVASNRSLNRLKRDARSQPLDAIADLSDDGALTRIDDAILEGRYGRLLERSLAAACQRLTHRERRVLLWRYDHVLKVTEIAQRLQVHPSNVTREIERTCRQLRSYVIETLERDHGMSASSVEECLASAAENPCYSIVAMLRVVVDPQLA